LQADESATCADYKEPVYDRGHLVPNADMNRSAEAQAYSFFLSNMAPQHDLFNRRIWGHLEKLVRDWAKARGTIYVITGSVFDRDNDGQPDGVGGAEWMMPTRRVGVPSHFYKIVMHRTEAGELEALAILLPHLDMNPPDYADYLRHHLVSIDEIESRTGLNFLPGLGPLTEEAMERVVAPDLWPR
jgi:DNA/RNA endonuclease G (NUC1)